MEHDAEVRAKGAGPPDVIRTVMDGAEDAGQLAARFRRVIGAFGPIPVARFMGESNAIYYASRNPLGAPDGSGGGDFITAPDISQMFGELCGLWLADVWDRAGRSADAFYAELGPGRGTLATDALRAMATAGCRPDVHLVEGSPVLRAMQAAAIPAAQFHDEASALPRQRPVLLVANEFLDALPARQIVRTEAGWRERMVGIDSEGTFVFVAGPQPMDQAVPECFGDCEPGTIVETSPGAAAVVEHLADRLAVDGGAALLIDYGTLTPQTGSTLQAIRAHRKLDPFACPGEADLTVHVDFAVLSDIARRAGCRVQTATQGDWLQAIGIGQRADALMRAAPDRADDVKAAQARLCNPAAMGDLFKVMAITAPGWPPGSGFAS